jgi:Spy/CpxP family protein refolding chaperone
MTRTHWLVALLVVSVSFNIAAFGSAAVARARAKSAPAVPSCCAMHGQGGPVLNPAQTARLTALRADFQARAQTLQADYEARNAELARLALGGAAGSADRIDALSRECAELHRQIQLLAVENLGREAAVLEPSQRAAYSEAVCSRICPRMASPAMGSAGGCMGTTGP